MNLTVQGNTFTNSNAGGINYNNTSNGASANVTLNLGGAGALANTVQGGLKEFDLHALAGSTFTLVDKTNTLNNTRNPTGTVVTDPNAGAFGHFGAGGSLGFCDPDADLAFGYVMNDMGPRWMNPRTRALIDAVYACV